jgi:hypothetical protein
MWKTSGLIVVALVLLCAESVAGEDYNWGSRKGNVVSVQSESSSLYPEVRYSVTLAIKEGPSVNRYRLACTASYPCWSIGWLTGCQWEYGLASSVSGPEESPIYSASHSYQCIGPTFGACVAAATKLGFSSTGEQREEITSLQGTSGCSSK